MYVTNLILSASTINLVLSTAGLVIILILLAAFSLPPRASYHAFLSTDLLQFRIASLSS